MKVARESVGFMALFFTRIASWPEALRELDPSVTLGWGCLLSRSGQLSHRDEPVKNLNSVIPFRTKGGSRSTGSRVVAP